MTVEAEETHDWLQTMPAKGISPENAAREIGCSAKHVRELLNRKGPAFAVKGPNGRWQLTDCLDYRKWIDAQKRQKQRVAALRKHQLPPSIPINEIGPDLCDVFSQEGIDEVIEAIADACKIACVADVEAFQSQVREIEGLRFMRMKCRGNSPWPKIRLPSITWSASGRKRFIEEISPAIAFTALVSYEAFSSMVNTAVSQSLTPPGSP